jgi:gluconolactonase
MHGEKLSEKAPRPSRLHDRVGGHARRAPLILLAGLALAAAACATPEARPTFPTIGSVHREAAGLDALVAPSARIERLAEGFQWSEGPVWIADKRFLLFSDVPGNRIHRWSEAGGLSTYLEPSGYGGPKSAVFPQQGTNGLIRGPGKSILVADHGNRAVARIDLGTRARTLLTTHYQGKRFNSPNDLALARDGSIYFTDPPYGLEGMNQSPAKELTFNGVYRLLPSGEVKLLDNGLTFPNGIILSPDERTLYVAVSDPERAEILAYDVDAAGNTSRRRVFADLTPLVKAGLPGLPDGMAIDKAGNLFATGPGGVHIFTPAGVRLGRIDTGKAIANCKFGDDGATLYLTSSNFLARIRTRTSGLIRR